MVLYIFAVLLGVFGLVAMIGISVPGGLIFMAAAALISPVVMQKISDLTGRGWISPVAAVLAALLIGPIVTAITAPSAEEVALREERRAEAEEEKRQIAEARAEQQRAEERERAKRKAEADAKKAEEKRKKDCSDTVMAFVMSQNFVKRALKAPSTAKFPYAHDGDVAIQKTGECKFRVHGYVDAQNSFGAMIRTPYSIDMEYFPDSKKWGGSNLSM
ncbi:hypothetical protein [Paracandidimonas soli]|uniref:hypothetical protein n=1 Tax=Paracandidimonas soli TaxID=1917182 RepID=UPI0010465AF2|nr:hypothetical protein [Paracandidimonas soli]